MPYRPYPNRPANRRPGATRELFGLGKLSLFVIVICMGGWLLFQQTVHSQIRDRVQAKLSDALRDSGLTVQLGQARFLEGKGIELKDLQIDLANTPSTGPHSRLEIYEAFIDAPATMTQIASTDLKVRGIDVVRAKLTVVRDSEGQWDFQSVIDSLAALRSDSQVPFRLTDCEVRIVDQTISPTNPITLTNVNLESLQNIHQGRTFLQIKGGFQSPSISQLEFIAYLDRATKLWKAEIFAVDTNLSGEMVTVLPPSVRAELNELQTVSGKINLKADVRGTMSMDVIPSFEIQGNVDRLTIDDTRLPFPIRNASAKFRVNNAGFNLSDARGKLGTAGFSLNYRQSGFLERQQWHCDGEVTQFSCDYGPRLARWLPDHFNKFCEEYSPTGTSNIKFDLTDDGRNLARTIIGDITDMSFSYINLPYKVENCVGRVNWIGDICDFDVRSFSGKEVIEFKGRAKGLGKQPTYEINILVPGQLPIDQKMFDAMSAQPKLYQVIKAFSPTGRVGGIGKIEKRIPGGHIDKTFDVRLKRCSIRHDTFDYPIHNIFGLVHVENDEYRFDKLTGSNSSGKVLCNGTWDPTNGLNARFLCESIPLDDQLRFALKPDLQEIWNGFRPRGTLDFMRVDMRLPYNAPEVDLVVEARMEKSNDETAANYVSIYPVWFPYEINHLTGTVNIGDGKISLKDCEGQHQRTKVFCQGDGRYSDDAWSVKLKNLLVTSLKVDEELLAAVPRDLAPPIRQLKYQGLLGVSGEITVAGTSGTQFSTLQTATQAATHQTGNSSTINPGSRVPKSGPTYQPPTSSLAWDVRFDMTQAKMLIGVPVENVFGHVKLTGVYDGQTAECRGDLDIDSLTIYEAQVTNIRGPIWLDNHIVAAGRFSSIQNKNSTSNISPVGNDGRAQDAVTGQMHKGTVEFDAKMNSGGNNEYFLEAKLTDGCLSTTCREFGVQSDSIDGHSFAAIRLGGDYSGIHAQRGVGTIQLRNAKIYELPAFLSLLKILNVRELTRTAFDSADIDFTVQGENIDFNRMEFIGDAISLFGNGRMNLDRDIDLNFYPVIGRNRINIPVLSDLYHASSQKMYWIHVFGTLENPKTVRQPLPQLNDTLKKLFEPREKSGLANRFDRQPLRSSYLLNQRALQPNPSNTIRR